ncbi:MAG: hypothetical protein QW835_07860 [Candidatus Hadarchaeum sp.]
MPAETTRKIMKHGTSGVVAIPPDYRRYYNLTPGTKVKVLYDSFLLIIPPSMEHALREREKLIQELLK